MTISNSQAIAFFAETLGPVGVAEATDQERSCPPRPWVIAYGHTGDGNLHINVLPPRRVAVASTMIQA